MENNRFLEIDLMKILSCLAVIAIHITARGITDPDVHEVARNISMFFNALSNFAVPSFIFFSGLALMLRYGNKPLSFIGFIRKRMNSILIPYVGWSLTYYFVYAVAGYYAYVLSSILTAVALGTSEYHLYFVVILFQLYLLFPLLKGVITRLNPLVSLMLALAIHLYFCYRVQPFPYMDRIFVPYLIFFVAGMVWGHHFEAMKLFVQKHRVLVGALYLSLCVPYMYARFNPESSIAFFPQLWQLFSLTSIVLLMTLSTALSPKFSAKDQITGIITLSGATFYVYLAHPLLIAGFYKMCTIIGFNNLDIILPVNYVFAAGISFIGALLYMNLKRKRNVRKLESA